MATPFGRLSGSGSRLQTEAARDARNIFGPKCSLEFLMPSSTETGSLSSPAVRARAILGGADVPQAAGAPLAAALELVKQGLHPVPIPFRSKRVLIEGWQALRLTTETVPQYFREELMNVGVLLGDEFGSVDIDCDTPEAIAAAAVYAPETRMLFGRSSGRRSHRIYRSDPPVPFIQFRDPTDGAMLVEQRGRARTGETGHQTVVPPSVHESGESIQYEPGCGPWPANIDAAELESAVRRIAASALLARHWPAAGTGRNAAELALAGVLARAQWTEQDATTFVLTTYTAVTTHDPRALDRVRRSVAATFAKQEAGEEVTGFPTFAAAVGERVAKAAAMWLGLHWQPAAEAERSNPLGTYSDNHWRDRLQLSDRGKPHPNLANALTALRHAPAWRGVLAHDEFALTVVATRPAPWGGPKAGSAWGDQEDRLANEWLQREGIMVKLEVAGQAIQTVARENSFHPVRQYLDGLRWDGIARIDRWIFDYLGVGELGDSAGFVSAAGAKWLIAAAARIYSPGCRVDTALVVEGPQGAGKSRSFEALGQPWFTDDLAEIGSKDSAMQTAGAWIIELSELDSLSRADAEKTKAFMSRPTDRFRPPYSKRVIAAPRGCVFVGTTNRDCYLKDETGARRFWPVRCGSRIEVDAIARDRDQLWAEAKVRFERGEHWWFHELGLREAAAVEQSARYDSDSWQELIAEWAGGRRSVTVNQVLTLCLEKPAGQWNQTDKVRIARCLRALGWERYRIREGPALTWAYRRA